MKIVSQIKTESLFRYRTGFIRNGKRHFVTPWRSNLILDSGLDKVGGMRWAETFQYCLFGNQVSPTPVARNGGAINFSQTLTTITASGGFFVAQDTGRLFKFDSGEEAYLTYVNSTTATASISRSVGSGPGTVWYVNQTALESPHSATNTYGTDGGDNGSTYVGAVQTMKRTFVGAAVAAPVTLTEIGFSDSNVNANIFDRDIIVGGVSLIIGDQPLAVAELIVTYTQTTPAAVGNVATGFDSSGTFQVVCFRLGADANISEVASSGATDVGFGDNVLEPFCISQGDVYTASPTIPAFTTGDPVITTAHVRTTDTKLSYSNGNFYRDCTHSLTVAQANGTIYGFNNRAGSPGWMLKLTTPFTKTSAQILTFSTRKSWQRILVN